MRTPRETFVQSGHARDWSRVVSTATFEQACDYALLQLQSEMPFNTTPNLPTDPYVGMDANGQMHGAARVLKILSTLHEPIKQPQPPKRESLNYHA